MSDRKPENPALAQGVIPFLWFEKDAEVAARRYVELLGGQLLEVSPMMCSFELRGCRFMALNGGPRFPHTEAFSMFVPCEDQEEVDRLWAALLEGGGVEQQCGWLKDRWGLCWQIVPRMLFGVIGGPDAAGRERATRAMLAMKKLDIAALEAAYAG